jgi:hypothetical protein
MANEQICFEEVRSPSGLTSGNWGFKGTEAYLENSPGDIKMCISQSIIIIKKFKKIYILSIFTLWDGLSLKTISRYCPFNPLPKATHSLDI